MLYKKILMVALLAVTSWAQDDQEPLAPHKCTHDHQEFEEPDLVDIEEDFNPEGNDHTGRQLASYNNFRAYGYYGAVTGSLKSYVTNDLIPPIIDYFSSALRIKYPTTGKLKFSGSSTCGFSTPSVLKSGVNADYVYFVYVDSSSTYVASTTTCSLASGSNRPIAGKTVISSRYVKATSDPMLHEKNMICIMHEFVHALGFSGGLYKRWLNSNGRTLTGHVTSGSFDGHSATVINAEPLTSRLRKFYGCNTLKGAYIENDGGSGTAGSHFERSLFGYEAMTSGLISQMQVSQFTLAILESTGWYVPNYDHADPFTFGQGEGCGFFSSCSASKFSDYCSGSARQCVGTKQGGGSCSSDSRSGGCNWVHPRDQYDCNNPSASSYARLPSLQSFGRTSNSKCFTGTLNSRSAGSQTTFCFKSTCSGSGSSTKLTLNVGGKSVVCSKKGNVSVSGYAGVINCPDPIDFCESVGTTCPRGCMGRGTCQNGACVCNRGYKGKDCALRA